MEQQIYSSETKVDSAGEDVLFTQIKIFVISLWVLRYLK